MLRDFGCPLANGIGGFVIRITSGIDFSQLKELCTTLETDSSGTRIADIDLFINDHEKISREKSVK